MKSTKLEPRIVLGRKEEGPKVKVTMDHEVLKDAEGVETKYMVTETQLSLPTVSGYRDQFRFSIFKDKSHTR